MEDDFVKYIEFKNIIYYKNAPHLIQHCKKVVKVSIITQFHVSPNMCTSRGSGTCEDLILLSIASRFRDGF